MDAVSLIKTALIRLSSAAVIIAVTDALMPQCDKRGSISFAAKTVIILALILPVILLFAKRS